MSSIQRTTAGLVVLATAFLAACGDAGPRTVQPEGGPGLLSVHLRTPYTDDGALSLAVRGDGMEGPEAVDVDARLFAYPGDADGELRLAVVGDGLSGAVVRFRVPDVNDVESYTVEILEVADESGRLRPSLDGYAASISP